MELYHIEMLSFVLLFQYDRHVSLQVQGKRISGSRDLDVRNEGVRRHFTRSWRSNLPTFFSL